MKETHTRLYLIRHGEVEERFHRIFGGRIDMELSGRGHLQAEAVARFLEPMAFDGIYCSPLKRAQLTLAPLLAGRPLPPCTEADLREVDFGIWTGHAWDDIQHQFGVSAFDWLAELAAGRVAEAETGAVLLNRLQPLVAGWQERHPGQSVAVVCHGGVIRGLLSLMLDMPLPDTARLEIDYCSITIVECRPHRSILQLLNYTPWRPVI